MTSSTSDRAGREPFPRALRAEWTRFRTGRGRLLALAASVLVTVSLGSLIAAGVRTTCVTGEGEGACPAPLTGPGGTAVSDKYYFVHRPLTGDGGITARVTDLTGTIRLPDAVPGVRNVAEGVVPWAKAGLLLRPSLEQGTAYAAVMLTGDHGVRMQYNYTHDVPGGPHNGPQWLRLTRSGDTITGYESDDGRTWTEVGTVELAGLPETVEIGLFATSPGALWETASAFAQATATFDEITARGATGAWRRDDVGVGMESDGRTPHHPGGAVRSGDKLIVTGNGDIGPATVDGGVRADLLLLGAALGLIPLILASATFPPPKHHPTPPKPTSPPGAGGLGGRGSARLLMAGAVVAGGAAFVTGLVASGVVIPAGLAMLRANGNPIQPITLATELRMIVGYGVLTAAVAVLALGVAALVKRGIVAAGLVVALVVVPQLLAIAGVAPWLLMITPAAGFAITQSVPTFGHVDVGPSPLFGHYPLPPWAGLTMTCVYAALALGAAITAHRQRT